MISSIFSTYNSKRNNKTDHSENLKKQKRIPSFETEKSTSSFSTVSSSSTSSTFWDFEVCSKLCRSKSFGYNTNTNNWNIKDFNLEGRLGSGKFGAVFKATEHETKEEIALKKMHKKNVLKCNILKTQIKREIEIHSRLSHSNIIEFLGYFHDEDDIYITLELAKGNLYHSAHIHRISPQADLKFDVNIAATYIKQVSSALQYLHSQNIYHRDLKPENILFTKKLEKEIVKLCDFGWSIHAIKSQFLRLTLCGTPEYVSPEMLKTQSGYQYDVRYVDIWSLGILAVELVHGSTPFTPGEENGSVGKEKVFRLIRSFRLSNLKYFKESYSCDFYDFISQILSKSPKQRLLISEIPQHPWLKKKSSTC